MSTQQKKAKRPRYPSDMSQNGWEKLRTLLPESKSNVVQGGRPASDLKEIINGILYVVKTGCS